MQTYTNLEKKKKKEKQNLKYFRLKKPFDQGHDQIALKNNALAFAKLFCFISN